MKNPSHAKKKEVISNTGSAMHKLQVDNNLAYYHYFYLSFVSFLLLVNILFQSGATNIIIKRAWGINNFSYFPWWVQALVFVFLYAFAIPSINNSFRLFIRKHLTGEDRKFKKLIWFIGFSLFITLLFYLFRVKYDLLGDMNLRVEQTTQGKYIDDEYLTMYFMHYLNSVLQKLLHFNPHQTFVFASIAAGFFYSFIGLLIADLLFDTIPSIVIFFLFYMSVGTILVFCGYTEIYAIPAASVSLYMYSALLFFKKKVSIIVPFLCMVLAVALHKEQISVLPSFIFLATRKFKFTQKIDVKIILLLFLISISLIYILNAVLHLQSLMPLTKDKQFPNLLTLFSPLYWWESFNAQYISSGILLFLFMLILIKAVKGQIQLDDYSKFFLIATLFIYSIIITMNKERGSGDWDVCSFPAIYLSMFVAYILLKELKVIYSPGKLFYLISTALLLSSLNCWAWVGINSNGKKSLTKIEDMVLTDPGWYYQVRLPSEMELSIIFDRYSTHEKAMNYFKLSYEKYGKLNLTSRFNYVYHLMDDKDTDKAIPILERTATDQPCFFDSYNLLFPIYQKRKEYDKVYAMSRLLVTMYDRIPDNIRNNQNNNNFLMKTIGYVYQTSLKRNDTAAYRDVVMIMNQLHINLPAK